MVTKEGTGPTRLRVSLLHQYNRHPLLVGNLFEGARIAENSSE